MTSDSLAVEGAQILPFYIVVDTSGSMVAELPALNNALVQLKGEIQSNLFLADVAQVGVITFSDSARTIIPVMNFAEDQTITNGSSPLSIGGGTNYEAAFVELKRRIDEDITRLRASGQARVYRPIAFFITDGQPNSDDYESAFNDLVNSKRAPNIVPFGFKDARAETLDKITFPRSRRDSKNPSKYFIAKGGVDATTAINDIIKIVTQSVISCGQSAETSADGNPQFGIVQPDSTKDTIDANEVWDEME